MGDKHVTLLGAVIDLSKPCYYEKATSWGQSSSEQIVLSGYHLIFFFRGSLQLYRNKDANSKLLTIIN